MRFLLLLYFLGGTIVFTFKAGAQTPNSSADLGGVDLRDGIQLQDRLGSTNAGLSVLKGVVTYVGAGQSLVTLQNGERVHVLRLDQTNNGFKVGEFIEMECVLSPYFPILPSFPDQPAAREIRGLFEAPSDWSDYYLSRMWGFLRPEISGEYTFWIASDDSSELWLGQGMDPKQAEKIAYVPDGRFTLPREWTRTGAQQSKPIWLEAGRSYYIEALHQDTRGNDCLAVAWQGPGFDRCVIEGKYLRPWPAADDASHRQRPGILWEAWTNFFTSDLSVFGENQGPAFKCSVTKILKREPGELPPPVRIAADEPLTSKIGFHRVELEGELQFVSQAGEWLELELKHGDARLMARVKSGADLAARFPLNSTLEVRGTFEPEHSVLNGVVEGTVWVDQAEDIRWKDDEENWAKVPIMAQHQLKANNTEMGAGKVLRLQGTVEEETSPGIWQMRGRDTYYAYVSSDGTNWSPLSVPIELQFKNVLLAGIAVASHATGEVAEVQFDNVAGLGDQLSGAKLGQPLIDGSIEYRQGSYTLIGNGSDFWRQADQGFLAFEPKLGDFQITAHLKGIKCADNFAKTVIMMRESLDPEGAWVGVAIAPNQRVGLQWRAQSKNNAVGMMENRAEKWVKLVRQRNEFEVKAKPYSLQPGQSLEILGRLEWLGQTPVLDTLQVRTAPASPSVAPQFTRSGQSATGERLTLIKNISAEAVAILSEGSRFSLRARIGGVVTFAGQVGDEWLGFIQDQSGGVRVVPTPGNLRNLFHVGDEVELVGSPSLSGKSPEFIANGLIQLGRATPPEVAELPTQWPADSSLDAKWTEVEGVAHSLTAAGRLQLMTRFGVVDAVLNTGFTNDYIDSRVKVRGVFWRMPGPILLLPSEGCVAVLEAAPKDVFNVPLFPIAAVLTNQTTPATDRRLKISGVVTCRRNEFLMVQDETGGIRLNTRSQTNIVVGDKIEAVGFPTQSVAGKSLSEVILRQVGTGEVSTRTMLTVEDIFQPKTRGQLVSLEAVMVAQHSGDMIETLDLQADQRMFRATLPKTGKKLNQIAAGSQLRLTGVVLADGGDATLTSEAGKNASMVGSVEILLRDPQDVTVTKSPPWWNWKYTLATIGVVAMILAGAVLWIRTLHRQVGQRTLELRQTMSQLQKETQVSATLAERDRLAGEIHDSLEQGLSAIMMQMEAAAKLVHQPDQVAQYLNMARNMASFSRTEVQHAVWDLQSPMLENADLGTALHRIAREISAGDTPRVTVQIIGEVRSLPSQAEHHLLRIGQEAITNAVKHGQPKNIELILEYAMDNVKLTIRDDGCGFDPQAVVAKEGHFGLQGLRVRAQKLHGLLTVLSKPGDGTSIQIVLSSEFQTKNLPS